MRSPRAAERRRAGALPEPLVAASFALGVAGFATTPFAREAAIDPLLMSVPAVQALAFLLIFQLVPALPILAADRLLARYGRERLHRYRGLIGALAFVFLGLHLLSLFARVAAEADYLFAIRALFAGLALGLIALLVVLVRAHLRWHAQTTQFFVVMGPVSVALALSLFSSLHTNAPHVSAAAAPSRPSSDLPPIFVVVFDELSQDALIDARGGLDGERFPHLAAFGRDSVVFRRATTNYFRTSYAVPEIIRAVSPLVDRAEIRLYLQYQGIERAVAECGSRFTCRGISKHVHDDPGRILGHMLLTAAMASVLQPGRAVAARALQPVANALGIPEAVADRDAFHLYHDVHVATFLDGIDGRNARGTVTVFHTHVSHFPYAFAPDGAPKRYRPDRALDEPPSSTSVWENYRSQLQYADAVFGQFIAKLRAEGLYDEAVIVMTADHGLRPEIPAVESSERIDIPRFVPHVPLIIHAPGLAPGVSDADYQHLDLGPTLHDLVPQLQDASWTGRSAFATQRPARDRWFVAAGWIYRSDERAESWEPARAVDEASLPLRTPPFQVRGGR